VKAQAGNKNIHGFADSEEEFDVRSNANRIT
jgi:hypothetical protein